MRYSPNHPTMRGRNIPPTLAERKAAVRDRLGIPQPPDRYKLKAWLGFVTFILAAGFVEERPLWAACLFPLMAWLWVSGVNEYNDKVGD